MIKHKSIKTFAGLSYQSDLTWIKFDAYSSP